MFRRGKLAAVAAAAVLPLAGAAGGSDVMEKDGEVRGFETAPEASAGDWRVRMRPLDAAQVEFNPCGREEHGDLLLEEVDPQAAYIGACDGPWETGGQPRGEFLESWVGHELESGANLLSNRGTKAVPAW